MTDTRVDFWDLAGTSLETYAWNVRTRGGSLRGTPPPRGSNRPVPHHHGAIYVPKYRDSRILQFLMWIVGSEQDGSIPTDVTRAQQFDENLKALQDLFDFEDQRTLTKRWYEGVTLKSASAQVEYAGGLEPEMWGPQGGNFSPELLLADPWFYEAGIAFSVDGAAKTIRGSHATDKMTVSLAAGARVTIGDRWVQNNGGGTMTIDVQERYGTIGGVVSNGLIQRNKLDPTWLALPVGSVTPTATGTCSITYYPRWR
jgi:hypothetical protein